MWLRPLRHLALGEYSLLFRVYDSKMLFQDSSVIVEVCDCKGDDVTCSSGVYASNFLILPISVLAAILCFLGKQTTNKYGVTNKKNVYIPKYDILIPKYIFVNLFIHYHLSLGSVIVFLILF